MRHVGMTSPCLTELSEECAAWLSEKPSRFGQLIRKSSWQPVSFALVGSHSGRERIASVLVALASVGAARIGQGQGPGKFGLSLGWFYVLAGVSVATIWMLRTHNKSAAPGYALVFVVIGLSKLWLDTGFKNTFSGSVRLNEIDAVVRLVVILIIFVVAAAGMRVLVTKPTRGAIAVSFGTKESRDTMCTPLC